MQGPPASVGEGPPLPAPGGWRVWLALNSSTGALLAAILLVGMGSELWSPLMPEYLAGLAAPVLLIALYGSAKDLLEAVRKCQGRNMLLVGHQPLLGDAVAELRHRCHHARAASANC